jgi:Uma2 family endonuclease
MKTMPNGPRRPASYDDLVALPEHLIGEIVDGELIASPRPALRHAAAASSLHGGLYGAFDRRGRGGSGGWVILFEPELHVVGQVLVPDIAGWRTARMPQIPDAAFVEVAPDWICEVLSPGTVALDRTRKVHHYGRAGVGHLWLLDPVPETLEVYRLESGAWILVTSVAGAVKVRAVPFETTELDLAGVWAR